ncbi:MAG TPA: hypothetical protein VJT67_17795 [Longimicrobiaceae bacterium]|nr:hypothetical protein [Longimicrobiaceae bacterium]
MQAAHAGLRPRSSGGTLVASVAYGRTRRIPLRTSPRRRLVLQPAA